MSDSCEPDASSIVLLVSMEVEDCCFLCLCIQEGLLLPSLSGDSSSSLGTGGGASAGGGAEAASNGDASSCAAA